jgi:hypothetical protein
LFLLEVLAPQGIGVQVPSSAPIQRINKMREGQPNPVGLLFVVVAVSVAVVEILLLPMLSDHLLNELENSAASESRILAP